MKELMTQITSPTTKPAILVTGGAGSIGSAIVEHLANTVGNTYTIRVFDNNEYEVWKLKERLRRNPNLRFLVGDVRDYPRLKEAMFGCRHVIHAAALKHVALCEYNPFDAVETNVIGTQNAIRAAFATGILKFLFISTDKAVNPTSLMGATKLIGERLVLAANYIKGDRQIMLSSARFPNVMETRGNVFEAWEHQFRTTGTILIRDPQMSRFFIHVEKAVAFIAEAFNYMTGGEIFYPTLCEEDRQRIEIVAKEWLDTHAYEAKVVWGVPEFGEKLVEDLHTITEAPYVQEVSPTMCVIRPPLYDFSQWKVKDE